MTCRGMSAQPLGGPPAYTPSVQPVVPSPPFPARPQGAFLTMATGILLGVAVFVGLLAYHAVFLIPAPTPSYVTITPERLAYQSLILGLGMVSALFMDIAVGASVAFAWFATAREGTSDAARRGFLTFAAIFLAVWLVISSFMFTAFRSFYWF